MRIISGKYKGRRLIGFKNQNIRPTADRTREAIFNIIGNLIDKGFEEKKVLDLYAGTGALGLEALSRGASKATFAERSRAALLVLKKNLSLIANPDSYEILPLSALRACAVLAEHGKRFDLIFIDPPYGKNLVSKTMWAISSMDISSRTAIIICEHSMRDSILEKYGNCKLCDRRRYGSTIISIFFKN